MGEVDFYYDFGQRDTISTRRSTINHHKLEHKRTTRLGVAQLLIGIFCAMSGVFSVVASIPAWDVFYLTKSSPGIWVGVLAFITGLFAVNSSRSLQRKKFMMNGFLAFTFIVLMADLVMIGLVVADLIVVAKAETKFDYEMAQLIDQHNIDDPNVSCLNLTIGEWLSDSEEIEDINSDEPPDNIMDATDNPFNVTGTTIRNLLDVNNTITAFITEGTVTINATSTVNISETGTTTQQPGGEDETATPTEGMIVRCIARSTFEQKIGINSILIVLGLIELIVASMSLYVLYEITSKFSRDYGNPRARFDNTNTDSNVEFDLPGAVPRNNNDYGLQNGHTIPVPKSIIQHTHIPQHDSFPDSDAFRSHLENFDNRPVSNG